MTDSEGTAHIIVPLSKKVLHKGYHAYYRLVAVTAEKYE